MLARHPDTPSNGIYVTDRTNLAGLPIKTFPSLAVQEGDVDTFESNTHSFVIKIWLEETQEEAESSSWRGHITHVPSKQRRYVENLDGISSFVSTYLEQMGIKAREPWQDIEKWLREQKLI